MKCKHEFKSYNGFSESYHYCVKCDHKTPAVFIPESDLKLLRESDGFEYNGILVLKNDSLDPSTIDRMRNEFYAAVDNTTQIRIPSFRAGKTKFFLNGVEFGEVKEGWDFTYKPLEILGLNESVDIDWDEQVELAAIRRDEEVQAREKSFLSNCITGLQYPEDYNKLTQKQLTTIANLKPPISEDTPTLSYIKYIDVKEWTGVYGDQDQDAPKEKQKDEPADSISPVEAAVDTLCRALKADPDYCHTWQANIAMAFKDQYVRTDLSEYEDIPEAIHDIANKAAINFLNILTRNYK